MQLNSTFTLSAIALGIAANPLTPTRDHRRIFPYSINTILSRQVRRVKNLNQSGDY